MTKNSFKYAISGIAKEMLAGASFKVMLIILAIVIAAGIIFGITALEWLIILMCSAAVLTSEMFNTAIETVVDMITKEHDPKAEMAKDIAAGAVLVFSIFSSVIGAIIFLPYIIALFK